MCCKPSEHAPLRLVMFKTVNAKRTYSWSWRGKPLNASMVINTEAYITPSSWSKAAVSWWCQAERYNPDISENNSPKRQTYGKFPSIPKVGQHHGGTDPDAESQLDKVVQHLPEHYYRKSLPPRGSEEGLWLVSTRSRTTSPKRRPRGSAVSQWGRVCGETQDRELTRW